MVQTAQVLKSSDVEIDGCFQIGLGTSVSTQNSDKRPILSPHVRIAEKQGNFALLEFTCSCGQKTQIRCNFAEPENAGQSPAKTK